ncbi:MAG: hypothetical protein H7263_09040 [Candidatus Sericytochromatia bacterium]|nr:hypothetical protein [Candidatus Sericytochromatia bacterium]
MAIYNTFKFTTKDFKDKNEFLDKLLELKNSGTDFSLPVITPKGILSFTDYIIGNTSLNFYGKAVKNKLVQNSYAFKIKDGAVIEHEVYNLKWMKNNFTSHKELILNAIECLAKELNTNPANKFIGNIYSNKTYTVDDVPPLMHVINNVGNNRFSYHENAKAEIWDIALTHNIEIKDYLKSLLSNNIQIKRMLECPRHDTQFEFNGMPALLYHHEFLDSYIESNPAESLAIIYTAISKNYLKDVKKLIPIYQRSHNLSPENNYAMLHKARTPEMANLLMENGFSMYNYKPHYDYPEKKELLLSLCDEMNVETIDAILSFKPSHQEMMIKNAELVFKEFFDLNKYDKNLKLQTFEKMKLLVEHQFPLEQFDMLHVGFLLNKKKTSYSQWFIEHGANSAHCENFVRVLKQDNNFQKLLEKYSEIIDIKAPDFLCEIVRNIQYQNQSVKEYCKTISQEDLLKPTEKGGYVWWGLDTNSKTFTQFMHQSEDKLKIKNSFASDKDSWIAHLVLSDNFDRGLGFLEQYKNLFFSSDEKYPFKMQTSENILHKLFIGDTTSSNLNFFLNETDIDVKELLQEKNKEGQTPLEKLFFEDEYQKDRDLFRRQGAKLAQMSKEIINHLKSDFPFEAMVNHKEKAIDVINELFPEEDEFFEYYKEALKNKLVLQLPEKNTPQVKKIKI